MIEFTYKRNKAERVMLVDPLPNPAPEQIEDGELLARHRRFALFSKPGAGKTISTMTGWEKLLLQDATLKTLVIGPVSAVTQWIAHAGWYAHKHGLEVNAQYIAGTGIGIDPATNFLYVTYGALARAKSTLPAQVADYGADVVIIDECHRLAGHKANRTTAIFGTDCAGEDGAIGKATYVWPLTGTPVPRYYDGLWPMMRALWPHVLRQHKALYRYQFLAKFCEVEKVKRGHVVTTVVKGKQNGDLLNSMIFDPPLAVRRDIDDQLPTLRQRPVDIDFTPSRELRELEEACGNSFTAFSAEDDAVVANPLLVKAIHQLGLEKAPGVVSYIKDLLEEQDEPKGGILVLFWHRDVGEYLVDELDKVIPTRLMYGGTPRERRDTIQADFNAGKVGIIVGQLSAMGEVINLQRGGRHVVVVERMWSATALEQAYKRVWRRGQTRPVQVDYCIADSTLEDMQSRTLQNKLEAIAEFMK